MAYFYRSLSICLAVFFIGPSSAQAYDFYGRAQLKQDQKDAKRWSLSDWMAQKQKNGLVDSWLLFNAPSPYEFFMSIDTSTIEKTVNTNPPQTFRNYRGSLGAFVTLVGLYAEYETSDEELDQWKALFMFRLLGSSDQSTNLTLHYGLMNQSVNQDPTQYQVAGVRMNFYLIKAFALTGSYEHIFKATSTAGQESQGNRIEGGAHIEFGALRFYGSWYKETLDQVSGPIIGQQIRQGILFGSRVYF